MSSMMAGQSTTHMQPQSSLAPYFGIIFTVLVGVAIAGIGGMAYFLVLPEIKTTKHQISKLANNGNDSEESQVPKNQLTPYEVILKTLTQNERKVVEVLNLHEGNYLQKYIRNETGLSRLQTHRVVAHLVQRGIVTAEQSGNTNVVILEPWLKET